MRPCESDTVNECLKMLRIFKGKRNCNITWGVMEPRPDDRGQRAEVHYITSSTISYQFEAAKRLKIARRAVQKLYGPPSEGVQKLYAPG